MVNVSKEPDYGSLIGREFVLPCDCYVFCYDDERSGVPLITDKNAFPDGTLSDCIGKNLNGRIVLGEIKPGSRFKVESVFRQKFFSSVSPVQYYVFISVEGEHRWKKLDAIQLMNDWFKPTMFSPNYVGW